MQNIFLCYYFSESLLENTNFSIITLPHPAHKKPAKFCLDELNKKIYDVVTFNEPYRSWFIGETVKSDGTIQILTPVNPLFLGNLNINLNQQYMIAG